MLSEKEVQKLLNMKSLQTGEHIEMTDEMIHQQILQFVKTGLPDFDLKSNTKMVDALSGIEYSSVELPGEKDVQYECLTREKFEKVVQTIVLKMEQGERFSLNDVYNELGFTHFIGAVKL